MIAIAKPRPTNRLLGPDGAPFARPRRTAGDLQHATASDRDQFERRNRLAATYDVAQDANWNANHWVAADALDADNAH